MSEEGLIPEHMGSDKLDTSAGQEYSPSAEERREIKQVEKLFLKYKKYKSQYDEKWLDWYKMFRGRQWKEQRPSYRHSEVINLVFQTIQSQVPIITDTRPKFEFMPQEPQDFELAEILNDVAQADWVSKNWQIPLTEVIYEGHFYGTGLSCMKWDPDKEQIVYESSDPFYSFPDPKAEDVNVRCKGYIYAEPMELSEIKAKWPEKGKYVKADLIDLLRGSKQDLGPVKFKSPVNQQSVVEGSTVEDTEKEKALVLTTYVMSEELEEVESKDPTSGEVTVESRLKYPNGKKIVIANGVHLESGPNPYEDGLWPYQRWQNYILPREFWGMSEIEQTEGPQRTFNKLISFALDVLTLMGNPIWVVDTTSGVDTENLFNRPGLIVEKEPGSEVRREEGVQLQPYVLQLIDRLKEWFDQVAGSNDVTRGLNPSGVTAASAIADLQNAAQTRIRQKSRNLDCYLQNLGQQYVSRVFQFYTAPQVFRLTGNDGAQKYFKFHVQRDDMGNTTAVVENFAQNEEGKYLSQGMNQYQVMGKFDVRVTTGSSLPFSKAEKREQLYGLFDRGVIDAEEVLKGLEYPNAEAVLARMEQKAQMQAQAEAQGAPPPAPAA